MTDFKCHHMLPVTPEQMKAIREDVSLTNLDNLEEAIQHVLEWFAKQNHLPDMQLDKRVIETIYISRKGSLEQTKQKLDMLFTMKSLLPDYVMPRDPLGPNIKTIAKNFNFTPLPKLAPDNTRIIVLQYRNKDPDKFIIMDAAKLTNMVLEYRLHNDYAIGIRVIIDNANLTLPIFFKWTPTFLNNVEIFITRCYGTRLKGIHFINAPSFIGHLTNFLKMGFKPKMLDRVKMHDSLEDLHIVFPKEILPKDLGGSEPALNDIADEWYKEFCKPENRQFFIDSEKWKSDENKRIGGKINAGEFGVDGTFRKLEVF